MITDSTELKKWLKKRLKDKRYVHSLGVADMAGMLMKRFGYSKKAGVICGLYHDAYRYIEQDEGIRICETLGMKLYPEEYINPPLIHAPVAAAMMRSDIGPVPETFMKAVRFHTLGSKDMTKLGAAVYIADYAEPNRKHLTEEEREKILSLPSLEDMVLYILTEQDRYFRETGKKGAKVTTELEEFLRSGGKFEEDPSFAHGSSAADAAVRLQ